jgi:glycosyltransferase involved in cell wall biosynthesis
MNIVLLTQDLSSGGAQRQVCVLALEFRRRGHGVCVTTYSSGGFHLPLLERENIEHRFLGGYDKLSRSVNVRRFLRNHRQDVVLAFLGGPAAYAELAGLPRRSWALVVSERSTGVVGRSWFKTYLRLLADYVVTNSHSARMAIAATSPRLQSKLVTIYNAVHVAPHMPVRQIQGEQPNVRLVVAARMDRNKNPLGLLAALQKVRVSNPSLRLSVDWYGDQTTHPDVVRETRDVTTSFGLEGAFRIHPSTVSIHEVMSQADAVVLPSFCEGLPNAVCEGMMLGKPILMSAVSDAGNLVQDGVNGFLFDPHLPTSIADAIARFASLPPEERERMGRESRTRAEMLFDPSVVADRYLSVLRAAAARTSIRIMHWPEETWLPPQDAAHRQRTEAGRITDDRSSPGRSVGRARSLATARYDDHQRRRALSKLRLLMIGHVSSHPSGPTVLFQQLVESLRKDDRVDVRIVNVARRTQWTSNNVVNLAVAIKVTALMVLQLARSDVVVFHASPQAMLAYGPFAFVVAWLFHRPLVLRLFGGWLEQKYEKLGFVRTWLCNCTVLRADALLLETRYLVEYFRRRGVPHVEWFPNSTHLAELDHSPGSSSARCERFVFLGRVITEKGVDVLLDAVPRLTAGITVDVYGPLEDTHSAEEVNRRGRGSVFYRGVLTPAEVGARLFGYQALILPTFYHGEGQPGVILEAYSHGLPVIASRWRAIPEIVDDDCGILIPPHSSTALADAMNELHRDAARYERLRGGALKKREQFSSNQRTGQFIDICAGVIARRLVRRSGSPPGEKKRTGLGE